MPRRYKRSETDFLKLKKHDNPETNTEKFDIENYLNGNWDKINENAKKVNTDILNINSKNKEQDTNIEQLQENTETSSNKIAQLEKELKEAQEDFYQASIRGQASGEYIHVEDSSNCRAKIGIGGNQKQETREGYNQLKNEGTTQTLNNVTITKKEDETLVVNGTATEDFTFSIKRNIELEDGEQYKLSGCPNGGDEKKYALTINQYYENQSHFGQDYGDGVNFTYNGSLPINNNIYIRLFKGITYNNLIFKPMIVKGTEQKPYEQYGTSPSPDYKSEVEPVGSNVNIFDGEIEKGGINYQNGNVESATDRIRSKNFIEVDPNFQYTINRLDSNGKGLRIRGYDKDKNYVGYLGDNTNKTITFIPQTYSNTDMPHPNTKFYYMKFIDLDNNLNARYKIEKGTVATGYSEHGQGSIKVTKCNKNIMPILNLGNNYEYTGNGIKSLKRNDGVEVTRFKVRKGQTIKIGLKMISRPSKDSSYTIYFKDDNNIIAAFRHMNDSSHIELNKVYEKSYTANEDGEIFIKLWGNASSDIFEFQLWAELNTLTNYIQHEEQSYIMPVQQEMLVNDYLDYDNEEEVHTWGKKILDGTELWNKSGNKYPTFYFSPYDISSKFAVPENAKGLCNYFKQIGNTWEKDVMAFDIVNITTTHSNVRFCLGSNSTITTLEEWKNKLSEMYNSGQPLVLYFQLRTPIRQKFTDEQKAVAKELNNARTYKNVTNITTDSKAILSLDYVKDQETQNQKIQNEIDEIKQLLSTTQTSALLLDNMQTDIESEVK